MTQTSLRRWLWVHKWASLVCTLFLLVICITALPLIFREEVRGALDDSPPYAAVPNGTAKVSLDRLAGAARQMYPGEIIGSIFVDDDEPKTVVFMAPSWAAFIANRKAAHWIKFDSHTGQVLKQSKPFDGDGRPFLDIMLNLHRDLFAGLPGALFMGAMALLFVAAAVSGVILYAPFMRRRDFGTVCLDRSPRRKWLDLHNLLGIVTVTWGLVLGITGMINELSKPLFGLWQMTEVKEMLAPFRGKPVPAEFELSSPQAAYDTVRAALPGMTATSVVFPGSPFGSPYHYLIWTKGREPLTSRLFSPVLVDARTGALASAIRMPWYLRALEVSRPLHFGDYGGLPLKIIWALLDLVTILILGSGLYLWLKKEAGIRPRAFARLRRARVAA
jgi:uncharacterized iron-regulated membrane protein